MATIPEALAIAMSHHQSGRLQAAEQIAQHMLAACSGQTVPDRASDDYVQQAFDAFADRYDDVLD